MEKYEDSWYINKKTSMNSLITLVYCNLESYDFKSVVV